MIAAKTSTICSGNLFTVSPTNGTDIVPAGTTYTWSLPVAAGISGLAAGTGASSISGTLTNTTNAAIDVVYLVTPKSGSCTGLAFNVIVTVNPKPVLSSTLTPAAICSGTTFAYTASSAISGSTFAWTRAVVTSISNTVGGGSTGTISEVLTNTSTAPVDVTYVITTTANGCSNSQNVIVTVNPKPVLSSTLTPAAICSGTTFAYTASSAISGSTFAWTRAVVTSISNTVGGGSTGTISEVLTNTSTAPVDVTYVIITTANGCSNSQNVIVTVNPAAQVNDPNDQVVCKGVNTTAVNFTTSNVPSSGTTYTWINTSISPTGLGASGTGNIQSFTALNIVDYPVSAIVVVTPHFANGSVSCDGAVQTFTITVNPTAQVYDPENQSVCNGVSTTAIDFTTKNSGGTMSYTWINDTPGIGLAATGSGNIAAFNATNSGLSPVVATITVTPHFTSGSVTCDGPPQNFTITVYPTAKVDDPTDQVVCNGAKTSIVNFSTPNTGIPPMDYNWTNNTSGIGLAASGIGNISAFNAVNNGTTPITTLITVTPTFGYVVGSCSGLSQTFTITINPTAQVNDPTDQVVCNGGNTSAISFSTTTSGGTTSFTWTNNQTSIGLGGSGTGDISSFAVLNSGTSPVTATITVTPHFTNSLVACDGPTQSFTITVNPTAQVNDPTDQTVCNGANTGAVNFITTNSGGTTSYTWTNSTTSIGLAASGTGNIATFTATNSGTTPVVATIVVTPHFTNSSVTCDGATQTFTITINPTPSFSACPSNISQGTDTGICTAIVNYTATATGTPTPTITYSFSGATPGSGSGTGSGSIFNKGVTNVVITASNICADVTCSFTITVTDNQKPVITKCAETRDIEGCTTAAITGPVYSAAIATSSEAEFEDATNKGVVSDNCGIASVTYIDVVVSASCPIVVTRTWTLTDAAGNSTTCTQIINIKDTTKPTGTAPTGITGINACYVDATSPPSGTPSFNAATAVVGYSDNCGGTVTATLTNTFVTGTSCAWIVTYTFKVADACGNELTGQTIKHSGSDQTVPTFTVPAAITVYKDENCTNAVLPAQTGNPTNVADNCTTTPTVAHSDAAPVTGTCTGEQVITRTWKVEDNCGNVATKTQIITVKDNTGPVITGTLGTKTVEGCSIANAPAAATTVAELITEGLTSVSDNCTASNALIVTHSDTNNGTCPIIINRNYQVTDACGNSTTITSTYIIRIVDTAPPVITNVPAAITYNCASEVPVGQTTSVTVHDACSEFVTVTVTDVTTTGSCANKFTINRVWTAIDVCENITTATQVITVNDQTKPTFDQFPSDITVSCSSEVPAANTSSVTATDNCSGTVSVTVSADVITNKDCDNRYTIKRTYWATDICSNTASRTQMITVYDQIAPSISSIPVNLTVRCVSEIPAANTSSVTATDNCSGTVSVTVSADVITNKTCDNRYTINRTYWATDICGNQSSMTQTITVYDNIAPTIGSIPQNTTVSCASEVPVANTSSVTATDNCSGTVSVTVSADVISNQTCVNRYTISRTYWATDVCGNQSSMTQTINVDDQTAPVISGVPASQTYSCASEVPAGQTASVTASDLCSGTVSVTVSDTTVPGECANQFTILRKWTATDACGITSSATQTITVNDKIAPVISGIPGNLTVSCASEVPAANTSSVTATDNCSGIVSVTVSADVISNQTCANRYTISRTYWATDVCGNTASKTQTVTVNDQTAPLVSGNIQLITVSGCSVSAAPAPVTNVAGLVALGLSISDGCSSTASITVTSSDAVSGNCPIAVSRTYRITDACGNTSTYTQRINVVDNTAPVISGNLTLTEVEGCSVVSAPDAVTTVAALETLGLSISDNCIPNGSLNVSSSQTVNGTCPIVITRTYQVSDICGNSSIAVQTIRITDTSSPLITGTISSTTIEGCFVGDLPAAATTVSALEALGLNISDVCNPDSQLTVTSTQSSSGTCPIVVTRLYKIADACGNVSTATQTIRINDKTAPAITGILKIVMIEGCAAIDAPAPETTVAALETLGLAVNDACTIDANLVVTSTQTSTGTCPIVVTRIYKITDACGNFSTATQTINVGDTTAPIAKCKDITLSLKVDGTVTLLAKDIDGGSTDNCSIKSLVSSKTTFTCSEIGTHTITLTVTDNCGNFSTCNALVTVTDPNPPSLSINDVEVVEAAGKASLTVTLANARACDVSFTVNTANNVALAPGDYTSVNSIVYTISGGSTSVTVNVPITDDKLAESTETLFVKLSNPINSVIADDQGIVTIIDDDSPPTVIIGDASAKEGDNLNFPVSLGNVSSGDITVTLGFTHVTTSDGDFVTTPVTVTFPAGTISTTAVMPTINDYIQENTETFIVKVTGTTGSVGNTSDTGTGTIIDDDQKPIAIDDNLVTDEDIILRGNVNVNDYPNMKPGDVWSLLTQPLHGKVTMNPDGSFVYTPNANYNGNDSFTYKLCDTDGDCDDATVFIAMKPVDDLPIANDDTFTAHMDGTLDKLVSDNDLPSGDGGNIWSIVKQPTTGTVVFNSNGSFNYTPNVGFIGNDSFTYKLCDLDGDCDEAIVNIVVDDIIPNQIFTPNGDGQNDTYYVKNVEFYSSSRITIFNRWGNKVYQKTGYLNDWDGYSNMNKVGTKALPVGTYYYVIDYGVNRHKTGFLYLER